jgi:hypothetical protein
MQMRLPPVCASGAIVPKGKGSYYKAEVYYGYFFARASDRIWKIT